MAILGGKKKANKKDQAEKSTVEKVEQTFGQTNEPAITEDEKVMVKVGFEKLEDLDHEINEVEQKINKLNPLVKEENDAGDRNGKYILIRRELLRELEKLREEKAAITDELIARREPLTDPVKMVNEKYRYAREYQYSMALLQKAAGKIGELQEILAAFIALAPVHRQVIPTHLETLHAAKYNCLHVLEYMRPRDAQAFNEEMKQAQELLGKLRQEATDRERVRKEYAL